MAEAEQGGEEGAMTTQERIDELWEGVDRPGVDTLREWLNYSDFYTAPASTKFHGAEPGGLAQHSLNVFNLLARKVGHFDLPIPGQTIITCGLGHDLCKVGCYRPDSEPLTENQKYYIQKNLPGLWRQEEGIISKTWASNMIGWHKEGMQGDMPPKETSYTFDDPFPMGHGEKSCSILQQFIPLTEEERLAIRWHMLAFDAGIHFNYPSGFAFRAAVEMTPLVTLLFTADYEASNIIEGKQWGQK